MRSLLNTEIASLAFFGLGIILLPIFLVARLSCSTFCLELASPTYVHLEIASSINFKVACRRAITFKHGTRTPA